MRFGVDEAGKGPVLGSMFAAAVACEPADLPDGVGDSKTIAPARRETMAAEIREVATVAVAEVPVDRIDDPETDMNALTVAAHAAVIGDVARGHTEPDRPVGTVDAGDVDAGRFGRRVADAAEVDVSLSARHAADETDPLVGAASVVAKVERDAHVDRIDERHAAYDGVGSGYPSDPATRAFLAAYVEDRGEVPPCARSSWSTCDDVLAASEQAALGEF